VVDIGESPVNQGAAYGFLQGGKTKSGKAAAGNHEEDRSFNPVAELVLHGDPTLALAQRKSNCV
jgi:hypothetical protein